MDKRRKADNGRSPGLGSGSGPGSGSGLNIEIHPLLRDIAPTPKIPKNHNPLKRKVRDAFDPTSINPYLDQTSVSSGSRRRRDLHFVPQGKYIAEADALRSHQRQEAMEKKHVQEMSDKGLLPDISLAEDHYRLENPPVVEWWDRPYLEENRYGSKIEYENENAPITEFIQHPVFITDHPQNSAGDGTSVYLTKKEMKKMRRNERLEKLKEKQDRVKLGIDPPPPPKVRLSNLMNVLANESAKDPTALEMKVRQEAEARVKQHEQQNKERQLSKEEKRAKIHQQHERDMQKGLYGVVFRIDSLANGKNVYKIDINAKQLELKGICLHNPRFNLVIIQGGNKGIKFYKKLMLSRIKWLEEEPENKCQVVWENQIGEMRFKKWSQIHTEDDEHALDVLRNFGAESYWREALSLDNNE